MLRQVLRVLLPIGVLGVGFGVASAIRNSGTKADAATPPPVRVSVEVTTVTAADRPAAITGTGTVLPGAQIDLVPQVAGRIVEQATGLTPGTRFEQGDLIARIDARDYENQLATARANVAQAELDLALEEARGAQAEREWQLAGQQGDNPLALRKPHLDAARGKLEAARAQVSNAQLAIERTRLVAPWDAVVLTESIDVGQYVAPGAPIARLAGTARAKVRVTVPEADLVHVDVPGVNAETGSVAHVVQDLGNGHTIRIDGQVQRIAGELDAETRTATLLVSIEDPLHATEGGLPLLPGAWVTVTMDGRATERAFEVPRKALVDGSAVWVALPDDTLGRKAVTIGWSGPETVYVTAGLDDGDRVVLTPLSLPVPGMPLEVRTSTAQAE